MHIALVPMHIADQEGNPVALKVGDPVPSQVDPALLKQWIAEGAVSKRKRTPKPAVVTGDALIMTADLTII